MQQFEAVFDLGYLSIAFFMGLCLVLDRRKNARLFGLLALVLALGDSFHLLPRMVSIFQVDGFSKNIFYLSWGKFVTSFTMTIFYLLYYFYFKRITHLSSKKRDFFIYGLVALRCLLLLLPQNNWGGEENYLFSILRNIPFLILGIDLVFLTFQQKNHLYIKRAYLYIALSFFFYTIVIIGTKFLPALGSFMVPKTLAYLFFIHQNYRLYMQAYQKDQLLMSSFAYLLLALLAGAFFREFTKAFHFTGQTSLGLVHGHLLFIGFVFLSLVYLLAKVQDYNSSTLDRFFRFYKPGLFLTLLPMFLKGFATVVSTAPSPVLFTVLAGLGHMVLAYAILSLVITSKGFVKA